VGGGGADHHDMPAIHAASARLAAAPRPRCGARDADTTLQAATCHWLRQLPAGRRPLRLAERHPHVLNRIAWCWADAGLVDAVFDDLLVDRRGGRQGFAPAVVLELRRLRDHRLQLDHH
jgi:hypothetical protein